MATAIITSEGNGKTFQIVDQWGNNPIYFDIFDPEKAKEFEEALEAYKESDEDAEELTD